MFDESEWNWLALTHQHSLGWVVARQDGATGRVRQRPLGRAGARVAAGHDGGDRRARGHDVGTELVARAREGARAAGCEWLHVDFDDHLRPFYFDACSFQPTNAGLITLA